MNQSDRARIGWLAAASLAVAAAGCGKPAALTAETPLSRRTVLVDDGAAEPATDPTDGSAADIGAREPVATPPSGSLDEVAAGMNRFACEFHRAHGGAGNAVFSPFSIHASLAMTAAGARGTTYDQMQSVLHLPDRERIAAAGDLARTATGDTRSSELSAANALWGQRGIAWNPTTMALLADRFAAGLQEADFAGDTAGALGAINRWVAARTGGRIDGLLAPGSLSPLTRLCLVSAVSFKGSWRTTFDPDLTAPQPFHRADGGDGEVPLMHRRGRERHHAAEGVQVLVLPYEGDGIEMVVILPERADGLPAVEEALSEEAITGWLEAAEPVEVAIWLPRFRIDHRFDAVSTLQSLGIDALFTPGAADLTGLADKEPLSVARVIHQAFIDVDEEGTEAAAATAVITNAPAPAPPRPVTFRADRPFLFLLRDARHGTVLFLGRFAGPG